LSEYVSRYKIQDAIFVSKIRIYSVVHKKTGHHIIGDNFVKCEPIFTLFAPSRR